MPDAVLSEVFRLLDMCVLESPPKSEQPLRLVTPAPDWLASLLGSFHAAEIPWSAMPFVDHFLTQAQEAWHEGPDASTTSEPFVAPGYNEEVLLRATALTVGRRRLLILERLSGKADLRPMLQLAREQKLEYERLVQDAGAVHAPAAAIEREVKALSAVALPKELVDPVNRLARASADLQSAVAPLPAQQSRHRRQART